MAAPIEIIEEKNMGNRAVVAFVDCSNAGNFHNLDAQDKSRYLNNSLIKDKSPSVYLHWNGGRDSVEGFLTVVKKLYGGSSSCLDAKERAVLFYSVVHRAGMGGVSTEVSTFKEVDADNGDNGTYWVDESFQIIDREYQRYPEQQNHPLDEFVNAVIEETVKNDALKLTEA